MILEDDSRSWQFRRYEALNLFSPAAPIDENDLFAGRSEQIESLIEAVLQRGQHAVVYGERGVGKTSLVRTFSTKLIGQIKSLASVIVNCDPADNFSRLWKKVFRDLESCGFSVVDSYPGEVTPDDVRRVLSRFDSTVTPIIILDEFDKVEDGLTKTLIANTIKALSDYSVSPTLIVVGVAKSVTDLIQEHQSISRALLQVHMPRMNRSELEEIIDKRLAKIGMTIQPEALSRIVSLSRGLPHYTHLLGQFAALRAIDDRVTELSLRHVSAAQSDCLGRVDQTIRHQYHQATQSPRGSNIYREVLLACALADADDLGFFPAKAVELPLTRIIGKPHDVAMFGQHLKRLCEPTRGQILELTGTPRRFRYRFVEPLMQPYIILRGITDRLIPDSMLP
jgi:hypothetical protein